MAFKTKSTKKGTTRSGANYTKSREVNRMNKYDRDIELARINAGNAKTQQVRAEQSGKTRRAVAYSGAAAASATSMSGDDQTVVYEQLATGGVGSSGNKDSVDSASGVTITQ